MTVAPERDQGRAQWEEGQGEEGWAQRRAWYSNWDRLYSPTFGVLWAKQ